LDTVPVIQPAVLDQRLPVIRQQLSA